MSNKNAIKVPTCVWMYADGSAEYGARTYGSIELMKAERERLQINIEAIDVVLDLFGDE